MKICFITESGFELNGEEGENDLILMPFFMCEPISYNAEIKGQTGFYKELAFMSKSAKTTLICGLDTESYGVVRRSAAVFDRGKLIGISDMLHIPEKSIYTSGGVLRVYDTSIGKIGVIVDNDIFCADFIKSVALCDADLIVGILNNVTDNIPILLSRARSFEYGVPIAVVANRFGFLTNIKGEVEISSPKKSFTTILQTEKNYKLVVSRIRQGRRDNQ